MREYFHHLFFPKESNNHRAKLLHHTSLLVLIAVLLASQLVLSTVQKHYSNVLGVTANISVNDLLSLTNKARAEEGLPSLTLNTDLANAAKAKGQDMFAKNYWAHNSPDGLTPWVFIRGANYQYLYAGENLARGFTTAPAVMSAWMASPGHRENILSPHYKDIGFAVFAGTLTGDDTVLVVEEFGSKNTDTAGTTTADTSQVVPNPTEKAISQSANPASVEKTKEVAGVDSKPLINKQSFSQTIGIIILSLFILLLIADIIIIERGKVKRFFTHNLDHIIYLTILLIIILVIGERIYRMSDYIKQYRQTFKKHIGYYVALLAIQLIELSLVSILAYDHRLVMLVIIMATLIFTSWVLLHHYFEHELTSRVVLEYILFGSVGIAVSFFVFH